MKRFLFGLFTRSNRPTAALRGRPQVEELEQRQLLTGDWFSTYLPSPLVANLVRNDWYNHGAVNYNDMLQVYGAIEQNGPVDANEFASLQFLTQNGSVLNAPPSECCLESQIVAGNPANATYQGYSLGNLFAGSQSWQLQALVNKWFLGMDHPATATNAGAYGSVITGAYGNTFGPGGVSFLDVHQGQVGDCRLLSSLAETAVRRPGVIQSMFTYDGSMIENGATVNVWQVRFYHNGSPVYVTVDSELPGGGGFYDQTANGSEWVALAEKAYAEANAAGFVTTRLAYSNSYAALDTGDPSWALAAITGQSARSFSINPASIAVAWQQGQLIVLTSSTSPSCP
jgi:hypothetical protein